MDFIPHFGLRYLLGDDLEAEVDLEDRVPLVFNNRRSPWDLQDNKFVKLFRLTKPLTRGLIQALEPRLPAARRSSAIPTDVRVLTALRFMASGSYQECIGQNRHLSLSQSSVSNCLHSVCDAMAPILKNYVKFPLTDVEMEEVKLGFWDKYGFPGTIGAVDGTHIPIVSPPKRDPHHPEHIYVNRKNFHSINTQIVSDSDNKILSIWARFPGSTHDSFIWRSSGLRDHLTSLHQRGQRNTWLIGDSGYGLEPVLMKPFDNVLDGSPEDMFNISLRRARASVECTVGILKNRFRCLLRDRTLHYYPPTAAKIIHCCAALHNICVINNVPLLLPHDEPMVPEENVNVENVVNVDYGRALVVRNQIVQNYFTR